MARKANVMSLSLDSETQQKLKLYALQKADNNVSKLIRDLVNKYLVSDDEVIPVILKIPIKLKTDKEGLENWLKLKFSAIVNAIYSS